MQSNSSFDKLSSALNCEFTSSASNDIDKQLETIKDKNTQISTLVKDKKSLSLKDHEFIDKQLKDVMKMTKNIMDSLSSEIKIGTSPRTYEVYGELSSAYVEQIQTLIQSNKLRADMEIMSGAADESLKPKNDNVNMSSSDLMKLILSAQQNSQLNAIDAEFLVEEGDKE
jgi:hypothetical protein